MEQWEENKSKEKSVEDVEKERISKKEVKDEPSELTKPEKDKEEEEDFEEKETKTEKLLAKEAESSVPKVQKKKEKQSSSRSDSKREGKSEENAMEKVGPMSQVFTKIAEGSSAGCGEERFTTGVGGSDMPSRDLSGVATVSGLTCSSPASG